MTMTLRELALEVLTTLRHHGFEALWAGGCVRDQLLGLTPHDYDVATNARPEQVRKLFRRTLAVGVQFGVIEVLGPGKLHVQVATFRSDGTYSDGRHPDAVTFGTAQADALRRDFTINGLFFDPLTHQVIDHVGGQADLQARIVRAIGDPWTRFREDHLRLLRAVRFAARFDFTLDPATRTALEALADQILTVSPERITEELRKMLAAPSRANAVRLLLHLRLLPHLMQPLQITVDERAPLATLKHLPAAASFPLALAALLMDVTDPAARASWPSGRRSPLHALAHNLRLSNQERDSLEWLLTHIVDFDNCQSWPPSRLKPLLAQPLAPLLLDLSTAIALGTGNAPVAAEHARSRLAAWGQEVNPPPLLTGSDLKQLGLEPGPKFKELLQSVRAAQLDGVLQSHDEAMKWVQDQLR
jgi:tRNA nucleotidyltransferase/poly(A) polymerase